MNQLPRNISSLEVAEMVGRPHDNVLKDVRRIISQLGGVKSYESYFIDSTYTNSQNKELPCFLLTKKGCELFGTRMTGEKGTQFALKYIDRFNEMEQHIQQPVVPQVSQAELIAMIAQQGVEQERRISEVEQRQQAIEQKQDNIAQIVALNPNEWREKVNVILNRIAITRGGGDQFRKVRNESYELLESRARCLLERRLSNRKKEALANGIIPKSKIEKFQKLDVIAEDTRLTEIYLAIVKEMAIKHSVNAEGLGA